jgi:hypothetical protein
MALQGDAVLVTASHTECHLLFVTNVETMQGTFCL